MNIQDLMKTIEDEIMVYNHVRDVNTGWVADLIVGVKNLMADDASAKDAEVPDFIGHEDE